MKNNRSIKIIGIVVLISVIVYSIYVLIFAKNNDEGLQYETRKITKGEIQASFSVDGKIIFDTWNLEFLNSGVVKNIAISLGDEVKKGDILAILDASSENDKVAQSKADLDASIAAKERLSEYGVDYKIKKKAYSAAKDKLDAEEDLYDENVDQYGKNSTQALSQKIKVKSAEADVETTKKQLEQVEISYKNSQYQINKSSAVYKQTLQAYDDYKIIAPVDNAIVAQINGTEGSVIINSNNTSYL